MTVSQRKKAIQDAITQVLNSNGAFFAFSKKQLEEGKKSEVSEYVSLGGGLICPKSNANDIYKKMDKATNPFYTNITLKEAEEIIEYEYFNHETQLSYGDSGMMDALAIYIEFNPNVFTTELIRKVKKDCWDKAVANDWF